MKSLIIIVSLTFLILPIFPAMANEYGEAYQQTQEQFQAVIDTVDQTKEQVDDLADKLSKIEEFVKANPSAVPDADKVLARIKEASDSLSSHSDTLDKFSGYAGKAKDAFEIANDVIALRDAAQSRSGGKLGESMHYIAAAMEKFGDKVPILGPAVEAYGQMTMGLLDATDKVAQSIEENRNQGMIGAGTYGGTDNEKYQKLEEQFGADFASSQTFEPSIPPFVYRPIDDPNGPALIWDQEKGEWYQVPGGVPVERIFHDNLVGGRRRDPAELAVLGQHYDKVKERQDQAQQITDFLNDHGGIPYDFGDAEELIAGFVYDQNANNRIREHLEELINELRAADRQNELRNLTDMLDRAGIKLDNWPPKEEGEKDPFSALDNTGVGGVMGGDASGGPIDSRSMQQPVGPSGGSLPSGGSGHSHVYVGGQMRDG